MRVKRDIVLLKGLDNVIGLRRYGYLWSAVEHVGVMVQEAARIAPSAVVLAPDSYLRVDYQQLGLCAMTWEQWVTSSGPTAPGPTN